MVNVAQNINEGKINIYACGGTGINVVKQMKKTNRANIHFLDTSTANLPEAVGKDSTGTLEDGVSYTIVEGMDGAGKFRSETFSAFAPIVEPVLLTHVPSKYLNIIVHSLAGGTGSTMGPVLANNFLQNGIPFVLFVHGPDSCLSSINNNIDVLSTYARIAEVRNSTISIYYVDGNRKTADPELIYGIDTFIRITDRQHTREMDSADLKNFLNISKVTGLDPSLAMIDIRDNGAEMPSDAGTLLAGSILISVDPAAELEGAVKPLYSTQVVLVDLKEDQSEYKDLRMDSYVGSIAQLLEYMSEEQTEIKNAIKTTKVTKIKQDEPVSEDNMFIL